MASKLFDLGGRRALVTGSTQGIGLALARGLSDHGATVVVNGRTPERVAAVVATMTAEGRQVDGAAFDVTDHGASAAGVD